MYIINSLNNREIATAIWLIIFLLWALSLRDVRKAVPSLVEAFLTEKLMIPFLDMLLYIFFMIMFFKNMGFWDASAAKDTILWILGTASVTFFNLNKVVNDEKYFRNAILDNLKFILILEFVVNFYSFSLVVELVLIPVISLVVLMNVLVERDAKYNQIKMFLNYVMGFIGLCILAFTFREVVVNFQDFATLNNLRNFLLLPLFSIAFLPFVYIMALLMEYEWFFTRINIFNKDSDISRYAKRKIFLACHINLPKLNKFSRTKGYLKVNSKEDVQILLKNMEANSHT